MFNALSKMRKKFVRSKKFYPQFQIPNHELSIQYSISISCPVLYHNTNDVC